jgi:hypothetical protein
MEKVKTAVVGVGSLGKHHLKWLNNIEISELIGFYDSDLVKQKQFAEEYPTLRVFQTLEELAGEVEAVTIVVPTVYHFKVASQLIGQGLHCLIEKPVTSLLDDAWKLQDMADKAGVKVAVGHIERFNPAVQAVLELGLQPAFIEAHRLAAFDPRGTDVAVVHDLMIHDIDLVLTFIKSKVIDIQASAVAVVSDQADIANARLTFENGAVANLTASRISLHQMRKLRIFQQSGYFSLDLAQKQADLYHLVKPGEEAQGFRVPIGKSDRELVYSKKTDTGEDMLQMELTTFLKAIIEDKPVAVTLAQATEALRVAVEVERIGQEALKRVLNQPHTQ